MANTLGSRARARRRAARLALLGGLLLGAGLLGTAPLPVAGAPAACRIVEGQSIGGLHIGAPVTTALAVSGPPERQETKGRQVLYTLRGPWARMVVEGGIVQRVSTRSSTCVTAGRVGPGATLAAVREAYVTAPASLLVPTSEGNQLQYPFSGIAFVIRNDRVDEAEVFAAEQPLPTGTAGTASPSPRPQSPQPAGWTIRSSSWRLEGSTFIVRGVVENRGRPLAAYAEVTAYSPSGRVVASSDGPLDRYPVPTNAAATFEARLSIDDVVRRYTITLRPVGSISVALAEQAAGVTPLQVFAPVVLRRMSVTVDFRNLPTRFFVTVTNRSSVTVVNATVIVDIEGFCVVQIVTQLRSVPYQGTGTVMVPEIRPDGSSQVLMGLPVGLNSDVCTDLASAAARARLLSVSLAE